MFAIRQKHEVYGEKNGHVSVTWNLHSCISIILKISSLLKICDSTSSMRLSKRIDLFAKNHFTVFWFFTPPFLSLVSLPISLYIHSWSLKFRHEEVMMWWPSQSHERKKWFLPWSLDLSPIENLRTWIVLILTRRLSPSNTFDKCDIHKQYKMSCP